MRPAGRIVGEVLEEAEIDETENIRRQFIKKYGSSDLSDRKTYEKAFRYFSSRGYGYNDIRTALVSALTGQEDY